MNNPSDFSQQLADLTVKLSGMVAERLAYWTKDLQPSERNKILNMIEEKLPDIIANTVARSPSMHNAEGVKFFEQNLDSWADVYAKQFIGKN